MPAAREGQASPGGGGNEVVRGKDLKCECGAGAKDVAPDVEIEPGSAVEWHCANGHLLISGYRPERQGSEAQEWAQQRYDEVTKP